MSQVKALLDSYQAGVLVDTIASTYGVHPATVQSHVRRAGLTGDRRHTPSLDPVALADAINLYVDGWTLRAAAKRYCMDPRALRTLLCGAGVVIRKPGRRSQS